MYVQTQNDNKRNHQYKYINRSNSISYVMWPRLVANKILRKRSFGSNNFVADFPIKSDTIVDSNPALSLGQPSLSADNIFRNNHKDTQTYKIFVSTWNVGGIAPKEGFDMEDWLQSTGNICDIYVLGFQEMVPLRPSNVLGSENCKLSTKWNSLIREGLNTKIYGKQNHKNVGLTKDVSPTDGGKVPDQSYRCIISKQMVGILISVWVRNDLRHYIRHPSVSCIGCGIMGCLGNKGSVSVRFQLHETSFCLVCSHLASGGKEGDEKHRNSDVVDILTRTCFSKGHFLDLPRKILDHDRVILFGDLNYRISLPEATTRKLVENNEWNALLENDQLRMELMSGQVLEGWQEGVIKFAPTYKYYPNSDVYFGFVDCKKEQKWRAPAWCDRILWYGEGLKQHQYARGESKLSDHRPVKAIFSVEVEVLKTLKGMQEFFRSERFGHQISNKLQISSSNHFPSNVRSSSFRIIDRDL
ncbi:hypothetical protein K2173_015113 [Erythroxylum novogranatense]|uniref:Inositol polyphosphate-related phosphatase domain-containing protein n=1 Tax=Erythroxylum novogranatense TaxID=1862640 RepID=A0AAV8T114_9ROSI|nr:hypothetical protein K2173_015113 [Erythroxylum novogranatense]